jgi:hypothetical protein
MVISDTFMAANFLEPLCRANFTFPYDPGVAMAINDVVMMMGGDDVGVMTW